MPGATHPHRKKRPRPRTLNEDAPVRACRHARRDLAGCPDEKDDIESSRLRSKRQIPKRLWETPMASTIFWDASVFLLMKTAPSVLLCPGKTRSEKPTRQLHGVARSAKSMVPNPLSPLGYLLSKRPQKMAGNPRSLVRTPSRESSPALSKSRVRSPCVGIISIN